MSFAVTVAPPAPALTTTTPWETVVEAYLDAAIDSAHTRRAYERHLRNAFGVFGVATVSELNGTDLARYRAAVVSSALAPGHRRRRWRRSAPSSRGVARWVRIACRAT